MKERHRKIRKESEESSLDIPELIGIWEEEIIKVEQKLNSSPELDDLVDVIRTSGLRAKIGRERDREFLGPEFQHWTHDWSTLKSQALIEAIYQRSKGNKKILIAYSIDDKQPENYQERLTFVLLTEPKPYRTSTALSNLTRIVSREDLMASLGKSDELPELPKPRRFYT